MDELEFRTRVYANPTDVDKDLLEAAQAEPRLQTILDDARAFEADLQHQLHNIEIPAALANTLLALPERAESSTPVASKLASTSFFQYYAMAASLVLAVGIAAVLTLNGGPSATETAFGADLIMHMYHEINEIDAITAGTDTSTIAMPAVAQVMAEAETQFNDEEFLRAMPVRFAKPCVIIPTYQSAHLMVQGSHGAVNVIVINNSPVNSEYSIQDDRFDGVVVPMNEGNLILIGEKDENLDEYKALFEDRVEWTI
jgi:hypothetical protein